MKKLFLFFGMLTVLFSGAQQSSKIENIIIVTSDGLRWQEVFNGMDSTIASINKFHGGDSAYIFERYWAATETERRKNLMPFLWSTIGTQGQLYGNRNFGNKVDNANPYKFSYPGYSEIFTGYPDSAVNSNDYPPNPNINVLEFINKQPGYKGKVAAFGAWEAFNRILNEKRSGFPVIAAFDQTGGTNATAKEQLINAMLKDSYKPWRQHECLDVFTHYATLEYLKTRKPRVLFIGYGETDEWAHAGRYNNYLDAAHQVDQWLGDLWSFVQSDLRYKNKTALLITVDHGRGDKNKENWTSHGQSIPDAHEIWFAVMGPGLPASGEIKTEMQLYQKQLAKTIADLLGMEFIADHPVADKITQIKEPR